MRKAERPVLSTVSGSMAQVHHCTDFKWPIALVHVSIHEFAVLVDCLYQFLSRDRFTLWLLAFGFVCVFSQDKAPLSYPDCSETPGPGDLPALASQIFITTAIHQHTEQRVNS